jgi:Icc-related predicted phosphoesterase
VRVLGLTDLHYRLPHYDWMLSASEDAAVVTVSGDLLDIVSPVPHEAQAVVAGTYLARLADRTDVLVSSGNHDLDGPGPTGEQEAGWLHRLELPRLYTDGASVDIEGVRFTVAPWWDGPRTRDLVGQLLAAAARDRPGRWVWVYHSPPAGTRLCFDGRRSFPDEELASWAAELQPDLIMCGHIHQAPWVPDGGWFDRLGDTLVINPGKQIGRVPPHVWLDTDAATATWYGLGETETTTLW